MSNKYPYYYCGGAGPLTPPAWVLRSGGVAATLDIDFVHNRVWGATGPISTLVSCSRASTGYYVNAAGVLSSFGNNVLRVGTNGLLVEQTSTNLILQSNTFGTTWAAANLTNVTTTTTGPDNVAASATLLNETTTNGLHGVTQGITKAASTLAYAMTIYAAQGVGRTRVVLQADDGAGNGANAVYDLAGGQVGVAAAGIGTAFTSLSATISPSALANGFYQCVLLFTTNAATTLNMKVYDDNGAGTAALSDSYAGTIGNGVYIYQAQLEQAAEATTPIFTTTGTATRQGDFNSMSYAASGSGTIYAQFIAPTVAINNGILSLSDGTSNNEIVLDLVGTLQQFNVDVGGVAQANIFAGTAVVNTLYKYAAAYAANDFAFYVAGSQIGTSASGSIPPSITTIIFGDNAGNANPGTKYIKRVACWKSRIANANLQPLST